MKKSKSHAQASARAAAERLQTSNAFGAGGFGGGFGSAFGSAFAGAGFGASISQTDEQPSDSPLSATSPSSSPPPSSSSSAAASSSGDVWASLLSSFHRAPHSELNNPQFHLALKQLQKRDPITKLKAIEACMQVIDGLNDATEATQALRSFIAAYERLHLDNDRRVREGIYKPFGALLSKAGAKALAPHLKMVFPIWYLHMHDPSREVARTARDLFERTFSTAEKQRQVLLFAHSTFFAYAGSLFAHTPQTLSDQTIYSAEESADRWERIVACALIALADFIDEIEGKDENEKEKEKQKQPAAASRSSSSHPTLATYTSVLNARVWKLRRSSVPPIRRALYILLRTIVAHDPQGFVAECTETLAPLIIVELMEERERGNVQQALEAWLPFIARYGKGKRDGKTSDVNAWKVILQKDGKPSKKKVDAASSSPDSAAISSPFYQRFSDVLRSGWHGNWKLFGPCLLPLLSCIPEEIMQLAPTVPTPSSDAFQPQSSQSTSSASPLLHFYAFFFRTLWDARRIIRRAAPSALLSDSREVSAWHQALNECIVYAARGKRFRLDAGGDSDDSVGTDDVSAAIVCQYLVREMLAPTLYAVSPSSAVDVSTPPDADSSSSTSPADNRFGSAFFTRLGSTLPHCCRALLPASMSSEGESGRNPADDVWNEISRVCLDVLESTSDEVLNDDSADAAAQSAIPSPMRRNNISTDATARQVDQFSAIGLALTAAHKSESMQDAVSSSSISSPILSVASAIFHRSFSLFSSRPLPRLSALRLCVDLGRSFGLSRLLVNDDGNKRSQALISFLSSSLIPLIRSLLLQADRAPTTDADAASRHLTRCHEALETVCRGLLAPLMQQIDDGTGGGGGVPATVWNELLDLLCSSAAPLPSATSSPLLLRAHLSLLRLFIEHVFISRASIDAMRNRTQIQDLIVTHAEQFLTCRNEEMCPDYLALFQSLFMLPSSLQSTFASSSSDSHSTPATSTASSNSHHALLLSQDVLIALIGSFLDAVDSFQRQEKDRHFLRQLDSSAMPTSFFHDEEEEPESNSNSRAFVTKFETETGCSIVVVPSLVRLLGGFISSNSTLHLLAPSDQDAIQTRNQIVRALFWLQQSARHTIADEAQSIWCSSLDTSYFISHPESLLDLARSFRHRLLTAPLSSFTSPFIVGWASWLRLLVCSVRDAAIQQKLIDAALPTHQHIRTMLGGECVVLPQEEEEEEEEESEEGGSDSKQNADASLSWSLNEIAERLRVIRDVLSELVSVQPPAAVANHTSIDAKMVLFGQVSAPSSTTSNAAATAAAQTPSSATSTFGRRLWLIADVLAIQHFLNGFEREPDASELQRHPTPLHSHSHSHSHPGDAIEKVEDETQQLSVYDRLRNMLSAGFLPSHQLIALVDLLLEESRAARTDDAMESGSVAAAASRTHAMYASRSFTSALRWLLQQLYDPAFSAIDIPSDSVMELRSTLVAFLSSIRIDQIRTHSHEAVWRPFESTIVTVLESGFILCSNSNSATATSPSPSSPSSPSPSSPTSLLSTMLQWCLDGIQAGLRLGKGSNAALFQLSSFIRISAAILRCISLGVETGTANDLRTTLQTAIKRIITIAPSLNLASALSTGADGYTHHASRFLEARAHLMHALLFSILHVAGTKEASATLAATFTPDLLQTSILWASSALKYAMNQHTAAIIRAQQQQQHQQDMKFDSATDVDAAIAPGCFDYLPPTMAFMSQLAPLLLSSSSALSSESHISAALQSFLSTCYRFMVGRIPASPSASSSSSLTSPSSPLFRLLSVRSFTRWSMDLEWFVRAIRLHRPQWIVDLLRDDFRPTHEQLAGDDRKKKNEKRVQDSASVRTLFKLLSHPFPSISLASMHLLSLGMLDRAICVPIDFDVDEGDEMAHVLEALTQWRKQQAATNKGKKRQQHQQQQQDVDGQNEEQAELEQQKRSILLNEYRRNLNQQRLDLLLPRTMQRILEEKMQVNEVEVFDEEEEEDEEDEARDDESMLFFSFRPIAQQLRGHMMTWALLFDLLSHALPVPTSKLTSLSASSFLTLPTPKRSLLLSTLRDADLFPSFASELIEHIVVTHQSDMDVQRKVRKMTMDAETEMKRLQREWMGEKSEEEKQPSPEPSVMIEDEDEDGNVRPAVRPSSDTASAAMDPTATPPPAPAGVLEYPLWLSPSFLLPQDPAPDVKVVPSAMKRLTRLNKESAESGQGRRGRSGSDAGYGVAAVDSCIFFGSLSCTLYLRCLRLLPSLSRSWFTSLDRSSSSVTARVTGMAFSPLIIAEEVGQVRREQERKRMEKEEAGAGAEDEDEEEEQFIVTTTFHPSSTASAAALASASASSSTAASSACINCTYKRGEIVMGLSLQLSSSHPLYPVSVSLAEHVHVKESQSRKWCLNIASILAGSDGSLLDAMDAWRRNLASQFSGVEPCAICMSVIAPANQALPRMKCRECSNKFHSACLYKWFSTSGNSQCPLCRSLFSA